MLEYGCGFKVIESCWGFKVLEYGRGFKVLEYCWGFKVLEYGWGFKQLLRLRHVLKGKG